MPGTKEIRSKISSVKSTQKITKAMQMVATSKMRRAQERMKLARPYADKIRTVIGNLSKANPEYRHPFMAALPPVAITVLYPQNAKTTPVVTDVSYNGRGALTSHQFLDSWVRAI